MLRRRPKPLEPKCETVSIGEVLRALWRPEQAAIQPFDRVQHRPIVLSQKPLRHMQPIVGINADQMRDSNR